MAMATRTCAPVATSQSPPLTLRILPRRRCVFYGDTYPNQECYDERVAQGVRQLMDVRRKFAYGSRADYFLEANCVGFARRGDVGRGEGIARGSCAVLISNAECPSGQERCVWLIFFRDRDGQVLMDVRSGDADAEPTEVPVHEIRMDMTLVRGSVCSVGELKLTGLQGNVNVQYRSLFEPKDQVVRVDAHGWATFTCPYGALQVWVRDEVQS
ncbi:hypothetical protein TRAPUB_12036 [Trametes pubescens]|uniref:Uncharacterized protein n=1 Tax=Trametes pubescens TaxID=154538 RepID=A0A1M2VV47_TRAPU|nr:hypothetical protein TRAPUB_12036 [Trametes pubescens]